MRSSRSSKAILSGLSSDTDQQIEPVDMDILDADTEQHEPLEIDILDNALREFYKVLEELYQKEDTADERAQVYRIGTDLAEEAKQLYKLDLKLEERTLVAKSLRCAVKLINAKDEGAINTATQDVKKCAEDISRLKETSKNFQEVEKWNRIKKYGGLFLVFAGFTLALVGVATGVGLPALGPAIAMVGTGFCAFKKYQDKLMENTLSHLTNATAEEGRQKMQTLRSR